MGVLMMTKQRILVIDDDDGYANFYLNELNVLYDVVLCACLDEFNRALARLQDYDLTIVDINFKGGGTNIVKKLQKHRGITYHKIVIHSDSSDEEFIQLVCNDDEIDMSNKSDNTSY